MIIIGVPAGLVVLVLALFLVLRGIGSGGKIPQSISLSFWGTYDSSVAFRDAISAYEKTYPNIHIEYRQLLPNEYEDSLIQAFAANSGPDIWMMHNTWLLKHWDKILQLPQTAAKGEKKPLFTYKQFQEQFVDVTDKDLTFNQEIYGLPLYTDNLALFYNKDMFNTAGIANPPRTWDDFNTDVERLTLKDERGNIIRSGAAIGTAQNINRSTDILSMIMIQHGTIMTDDEAKTATFADQVEGVSVGEKSLQYYTDFAQPIKGERYTWNESQHYSIDAFAEGNAAMMFNYSHNISILRGKSGRLNFGVAPAPQPAGASINVSYANYWAATVSKQSQYSYEAWRFLTYLTSNQGAKFYLKATGRPSARRDLLELQQSDPDLGVFANQSLTARSWYQPDSKAVETIFAQAINDVNYGKATPREAIQTAQSKVNVLFAKIR
ncbi:MAG: Uncharacterized protein CEN90_737 [Parcubacteria group bacterium Licking1014_17]|nr:MAG: Uncharacterized protein CEN90_737 [Parcubacteria group bacterium Licking1014_17]